MNDERLTIKDLLVVGAEAVLCFSCTIGMLAIGWCFAG